MRGGWLVGGVVMAAVTLGTVSGAEAQLVAERRAAPELAAGAWVNSELLAETGPKE